MMAKLFIASVYILSVRRTVQSVLIQLEISEKYWNKGKIQNIQDM